MSRLKLNFILPFLSLSLRYAAQNHFQAGRAGKQKEDFGGIW